MHRIALIIILIISFILKQYYSSNYNLVFDYDQQEAAFYTRKIVVDHKFPIIGQTIYGDPRLHQGVFFFYYNALPYFLSNGNLLASVTWNNAIATLCLCVIYLLTNSLFSKKSLALLATLFMAVSFQSIKFSSLLFNESLPIFLVPFFYYGLWLHLKGQPKGLLLSAVFLGLAIQSSLPYIYLVLILLVYQLVFKPKLPNKKIGLAALALLVLSVSTMALTEIKLKFAGVYAITHLHDSFPEARQSLTSSIWLFSQDFGKTFSSNLTPTHPSFGSILAILTLSALIILFITHRHNSAYPFLLLYLLSPAVTLILGYHQKTWYLINLAAPICISTATILFAFKRIQLLIPLSVFILWSNLSHLFAKPAAYTQFDNEYDITSQLSHQLQVVDFTYSQAQGQPFSINAVTYPLYHNAMWEYLYTWYGHSRYGYLPTWTGGHQLYPYALLPENDQTLPKHFTIISNTPRIPLKYQTQSTVIHSKSLPRIFPGFSVYY